MCSGDSLVMTSSVLFFFFCQLSPTTVTFSSFPTQSVQGEISCCLNSTGFFFDPRSKAKRRFYCVNFPPGKELSILKSYWILSTTENRHTATVENK